MTGPDGMALGVRVRPAQTILGIVVSVVAFAVVVRTVDLDAASATLGRATPEPLLLALGVIATQVVLVSARWRLLLPAPRGTPHLCHVVPAVLAGYLANLVLPGRLGEVVRSYVVSRRASLPLPETLGSVVLERLIDIATLAVLVLGAAVVAGLPPWVVSLAAIAAVAGAACLTLLVAGGLEPLVGVLQRVRRRRPSARMGPWLERGERILLGASGARRRRAVVLAIVATVATALLEAGVFWLVAASLGLGLTFPQAFIVAGVTVIGTAIPSAPAYLGTYEAAAVATAVALGVPEGPAFAFAVLAHAMTAVPLALGGLVAVIALQMGGVGLSRVAGVPSRDTE